MVSGVTDAITEDCWFLVLPLRERREIRDHFSLGRWQVLVVGKKSATLLVLQGLRVSQSASSMCDRVLPYGSIA